jgi:tetratricopeptide (TPR) repeat protein
MPTMLALLGLPAASDLPGNELTWVLNLPSSHPLQRIASYNHLKTRIAPQNTTRVPAADEAYVEKLRALGYLSGSAGQTPGRGETPGAWLNLGTFFLEQGNPQKALQAYRKALEADPRSPGAWLKAALALNKLGRKEQALEAYRKALELGGSEAHRESSFLGAGILLGELGQGNASVALLRAAATEIPSSFILWTTLAEAALSDGEGAIAREALEKALRLREDADVLNRLAALVWKLDADREQAARLWKRSLQLRPDQVRVREALDALPGGQAP